MARLFPELFPGTGTRASRMAPGSGRGSCVPRTVPKENHGQECREQRSACPPGRGDWTILCRDGHSRPLAGGRFNLNVEVP